MSQDATRYSNYDVMMIAVNSRRDPRTVRAYLKSPGSIRSMGASAIAQAISELIRDGKITGPTNTTQTVAAKTILDVAKSVEPDRRLPDGSPNPEWEEWVRNAWGD